MKKSLKKLFILPLLLLSLTSCSIFDESTSNPSTSSSTPTSTIKEPVITEGVNTIDDLATNYKNELDQFINDYILPVANRSIISSTGDFTSGSLVFIDISTTGSIKKSMVTKYVEDQELGTVSIIDATVTFDQEIPVNILPKYQENSEYISDIASGVTGFSSGNLTFKNLPEYDAIKEKITSSIVNGVYDTNLNISYMAKANSSDKEGYTKFGLFFVSTTGPAHYTFYIKDGTEEEMLAYLESPENYTYETGKSQSYKHYYTVA